MLEIALAVAAIAIALVLRAETMRRLRSLTLPLILVSLGALTHFTAQTLGVDDEVTRWSFWWSLTGCSSIGRGSSRLVSCVRWLP
jgi:hypothetical protein